MDTLNIIVTGASRGIGFEIARLFAALGNHNIVAIARNADGLKQLKNACIKENIGARLHPIAFDFNSDDTYTNTLIPQIKQHINRIDIVINNAGYLVNKNFDSLTYDEMHDMVAVNFLAVAKLTQALIPLLNTSGAHFVNISSMGGFQGSAKFKGLSVYSATKAALASLTECLAEEYKDTKFSFNCLALGAVSTQMFNAAFPGYTAPTTAPKIAEFIVNFAINAHKHINGKIIPISTSTP